MIETFCGCGHSVFFHTAYGCTARRDAEDDCSCGLFRQDSCVHGPKWIEVLDLRAIVSSLRMRLAGEDPAMRFKFYVYEDIGAVFAVSQSHASDHYVWTSARGWRVHDGRLKP